jgi:hypothetical protein
MLRWPSRFAFQALRVEDIAQAVQSWLTVLTCEGSNNSARDLLWDMLSGNERVEVSSKIV